MILRFGLLAILATALLAKLHGAAPLIKSAGGATTADLFSVLGGVVEALGPFGWKAWAPLLLVGLLGGWVSRSPSPLSSLYFGWRAFWLFLLTVGWLAVTGLTAQQTLSTLAGVGPLALKLARPYAVTTTLFLGLVALLWRSIRRRQPEAQALTLLFPFVLTVLLWANPAVGDLLWLPLMAAAGLAPWMGRVGASFAAVVRADEDLGDAFLDERPWAVAPALLLEGASLQCVAWGLALSVLGFATELWRDGVLAALFAGFGTGVPAWLFSGLLWGLADSSRGGRWPTEKLARWAFGSRAGEADASRLVGLASPGPEQG